MRSQTTGQELDLVLTFLITVSRLTRFFTYNQRLLSTVLSSQAHFFTNGAPNNTSRSSPQQFDPNLPIRCPTVPEKWSNSLQYTGYHNLKEQNAMIQQCTSRVNYWEFKPGSSTGFQHVELAFVHFP